MKFLRFGERGEERPGVLDGDGRIRNLSGVIPDLAGPVLGRLASLPAPETLPLVSGSPRIGACVGGIGKVICIGLNYADHASEARMQVPPEPLIFGKFTSAICGPNDPLIQPRGSDRLDWEVELAVIIGTAAKYVPEDRALDHVAGYAVFNDISERSFQLDRAGQWVKGKSSDTFGPLGPWLVTPDEAGDPQALGLWLDVNGTRRQDGSTAAMIHGVAALVSYLSQFFTLHPGDVIASGTPPGVGMGMTPPRYLAVGDVMRLGIDGLGEQRQQVVADT